MKTPSCTVHFPTRFLGCAAGALLLAWPAVSTASTEVGAGWFGSGTESLLKELAITQPEEAPAEPPPPPPGSWLEGWEGSIQFGLNGSEGNTERLSMRAELAALRATETMETRAALRYSYATTDGDNTENKARADVRNDWLLKDSRWRFFVLGLLEYDRFQDWDVRASIFPGVGYEFIKTDRTLLLGRAGVGLTYEFGGGDDLTPEALLGADLEHKLTERQKLTATVDLFPALDDLGEYRLNARAAWEILIDPEVNMSLKIGVEDRYDSRPGEGIDHNDLDYFALLAWNF